MGAQTVHGAVAPIEVEQDEGGNCFLFRRDGVVKVAIVAEPHLTWMREQGMELRYNHFARCPDAARFRQRSSRTSD